MSDRVGRSLNNVQYSTEMSRDIPVLVPDVEIVRIVAERTGHRGDLFAAIAATKTGRAGSPDLHAEVALTAAVVLIA